MTESEKNLGYDFEARNNLESYKIQKNNGFPILKELIQNANDAEATEMILKYFPGDKTADHPLLKNNKGIFVYNNGPFTDTNEKAMRTIGGSDKKKDANKVGKYGLGMKSIYHICDFFFYLVDGERVDFLNPWYKAGNPNYLHKEWSVLTENDKNVIRKHSPKITKATAEGLSILIPGKLDFEDEELHVSTGNSVKMDFPFGTNKEFLIKDLMLCLALLQNVSAKEKHLTKIIYELSDDDKITIIKVEDESKIICQDSKGHTIHTAEYASYTSTEIIDKNNISLFKKLDEKKLIGDKIVSDERLRKSTYVLVKTDLPQERKGNGNLNVKYSVFLPLQDPSYLEANIFTDNDYTLLINAPFMIDHGRQGMFGYKSLVEPIDEETINIISYKESASKCWNQLLAQNIVYPHLPNIFNEAIKNNICNKEDVKNILYGLRSISQKKEINVSLLNTFTTTAFGFAKKYHYEKGRLISNWELLDMKNQGKNQYIFIPDNSNEKSLLAVFPSLLKDNQSISFICGNTESNYLLPKDYAPTPDIIKKIISDFSKENFIDKNQIGLIKEFLSQLRQTFSDNTFLCEQLISKIKEAFSNSELSDLVTVKLALSDLLNTVNEITSTSPYKIYAVDSTNLNTLKIIPNDWKKMWIAKSDFIIVPKIFSINSTWSDEYKEKFLLGTEEDRSKSLCQFLIDNSLTGLSQNTVINGIVNVRKYIKKIIENFRDICIFGIINIRTQSKVEYKNSTEFFQLLNDKRIFNSVGVTVKVEELIYKYAMLLPNYDVYALLSKEDPENFGIEDTSLIIENTPQGVLDSLQKQDYKHLSYSDTYKATFINEVLRIPFTINDSDVDFYRFLLSGFQDIDSSNPYATEINAFVTECDFRWKKVFEFCKSPNTVMMPKEYDDCIKFAISNETNRKKLNINPINDKSCFEQLNAYSWNNKPMNFICADKDLYTEDFLTSILEKMSETDDRHKTLFRKLPFQKNYLTNEVVYEIDNDCYLNEADIIFPKGFESNRVLIKMDENDRICGFQKKFMKDRLLTYGKAVQIVLDEKEPEANYADWIFSNMMKSTAQELREIKQSLGHKKWIPTNSGKCCALNEILPSNLLSKTTCDAICGTVDFYTLDELRINEESKKFITKKELIPQLLPEIFNVLIMKLSELHEFYISFDSYEELKSAAYNLDSSYKFPIYNIIRELDKDKNIVTKDIIFRDFYQKLVSIEPSLEPYVEALNYLSEKAITDGLLTLFCRILSKVISNKAFRISSIKYPNKNNNWRTADSLTASDSDSISDEYLLNQRVYGVLEQYLPTSFVPLEENNNGKNNLTETSENTKIEVFFNTWRNKSDHPKLVDLALFLLRGNFRKNAITHTPEEKFSYLTTQFKYEPFILTNDYWNHGYAREQAFLDSGYRGYFKVTIQIPEDNMMLVLSLIGKSIKVPIKQNNFTNPIIFRPIYFHEENKVSIQLNKIPSDAKVSDDYAQKLIYQILKEVYFQTSEKAAIEINRLFENFCNSSQRTIEGTKERIFDDLFGILPSLSVKNPIFEKLNYELTECYDKKTAKTYDDQKFALERSRIVQCLINELSKSKELEEAIFTAVKQKVKLNQYMPENVLFELFQNADDCVNDLYICHKTISNQNRKFIIKLQNNEITVSHFGRGINDSLQTTDERLQGKFRQDLLNMLSLNASDKDTADGHTGKFGLGFKSIYKVCNQPIVRSGDLNFKIIAGIYPENIPAVSDFNTTEGCIETRYEMDIIPSVEMASITNSFEEYANFLTLFSKQIKEIILDGKKIKMEYKVLFHEDTYSVNFVSYEKDEYLLFSNTSDTLNYKIVFKLKKDLIEDISEEEGPKVWCLTPLESVKNLPFYLNSNFTVDTGRKNLACNDDDNKILLEKISINFANNLAKNKEILGEDKFNGIYEIIVHTGNLQEQTYPEFKKFGKDIIDILQKKIGVIPSGWGKSVLYTENSKLFYIPPTKYDPNISTPAKLLEPIQDFMQNINENIFVLTKSAADSLPDFISNKIDLLELDYILNYVESKELTPEILKLYLSISDVIPNYHLIHRVNNISSFRLLNERGQYIPCSQIILGENAPSGSRINKVYGDAIIDLLNDNSIFAANLNKLHEAENERLRRENEELKKGKQEPTPPLSQEDEPLYEVIWKPVESVYQWWLQKKETGEWTQIVENYYESHKYPSILSYNNLKAKLKLSEQQLFDLSKDEIPEEWCILLWIAAAQSMPYNWGNRDAANRNGIEELKSLGLVKSFCVGDNLQAVYESYLKNNLYEEKRIRLFELLLRLHKYRMNFGTFYDIIHNLPAKKSDNLTEFLCPARDQDLTGYGIDLAPSNITFKIGYRMIIQNLGLCGFWDDSSIEELKHLFKIFIGEDKEFDLSSEPEKLVKEFYQCFDLPFQITAETRQIGLQ